MKLRFHLAWTLAVVMVGCRDDAPEPEPVPGKQPVAGETSDATEGQVEPEQPPEPVAHFSGREEVETTVSGEGEGPYRFTARWHKSRADEWERMLARYKGRENLRYLEVGVFEGRSLIWMLENVLTHPTSTAVAVDIFMDEYEATYDGNIVASGASPRVTKIKEPSRTALRTLPLDSFDIIYIDGSHTADDVLADAVLSWDLLRDGGLVIFDDYSWGGRGKGGTLPPELVPRVAIDVFVLAHRYEVELVSRGAQVVLRKLGNPCQPKDYCSPVGQYLYFWREFELRDANGTVVPLSEEERALIERIAKARPHGEVDIRIDRTIRDSAVYKGLVERIDLDLRRRRAQDGPGSEH
jgi:predicted O-methyltransferase YrrM